MKRKADWILILVLLAAAAAVGIFLSITKKQGAQVVVEIEGEEYARYSLQEDRTEEIVTERGTNILVIAGGEAAVTEADCPDKLCVKQKAVRYEGQSIICLPHKLTVVIEGGEASELDFIVGK